MELALTTLLLLPGVVSLAIATGPRCRAIAPRDLPAALVAILAFALTNFAITAIACRVLLNARDLGSTVAVMLMGQPYQHISQQQVIADVFDGNYKLLCGLVFLGLATLGTGWLGARLYERLLQIIARNESGATLGLPDERRWYGKTFDWCLLKLGLTHAAIARGASYWLIVEQTAKLLAHKQPHVYADVVQGEPSKLFAGQVIQVITSRSGETLSVVLTKARRYRHTQYGDPDPDTGKRPIDREKGWTVIGDSIAFYIRGENVHNISYRLYGDPARGGYSDVRSGGELWRIEESVLNALRGAIKATSHASGTLSAESPSSPVAGQESSTVNPAADRPSST